MTQTNRPAQLALPPMTRARGTLALPGSKSLSNRALLLAALAAGDTRLRHLLDSDDVRHMTTALGRLGVPVRTGVEEPGTTTVSGRGGPFTGDPDTMTTLFLGNAGTAMRPLAAALCAGHGRFVLDGEPRMRERPIAHLVDALAPLGGDIRYLGTPGYPPLEVRAAGLRGGSTRIDGSVSSQFLTAVLMSAPLARAATDIEVTGALVSQPYIRITLRTMARFGVEVEHEDFLRYHVEPARYASPGEFIVEGDASTASYFLAAGAIAGGPVRVTGAGRGSVQGDTAFADVLAAMGADVTWGDDWIEVARPAGLERLKAVDLDLNHIPDAAMTLATAALFADGTTTIRNIGNWRVKETDRLAAMATELRKVGATVHEGPTHLSVTPPDEPTPAAAIDTYDDHRMAMCFALVALAGVPVTINDPACVNKTFPGFFEAFRNLAA